MQTGESSEVQISQDFVRVMNLGSEVKDDKAKYEENEGALDNDGVDEEEEEFSFMSGGANASPIAAEDAFINGQIKTVYPMLFYGDLPMRLPVKKVFVEAREATAVEASQSQSPEVCKKSNSTGFSKIWRFKDLLGRSNSDGRDTFVFFNHPTPKKKKTDSLSAHEAYLKSKAKEAHRRRSYLPYRPEFMGFFTNVNAGLTKNLHPF